MPNSAKSQASNMTPRKQSTNRLRCHFENGRRSSRAASSADFCCVPGAIRSSSPTCPKRQADFEEGSSGLDRQYALDLDRNLIRKRSHANGRARMLAGVAEYFDKEV